MYRWIVFALVLISQALAAECATGPIDQVPKGHWAYTAVDQLQKDGILVGYPGKAFDGSRELSRDEFAQAVARMVSHLKQIAATESLPETRNQMQDLDNRVTALENGKAPPPVPRQPQPVTTSPTTGGTGALATKDNLRALTSVPAAPTKADLDALRRLINEFRMDLQCARMDVAAARRDIQYMNERLRVAKQQRNQRPHWDATPSGGIFPKFRY